MKLHLQLFGLPYLLILWLATAGCGGSGTTEFGMSMGDAGGEAFAEEQAVIKEVSEEGGCAELEGTTICSSGEAVATGTTDNEVAFPASSRLMIEPSSRSNHACIEDLVQGTCSFTIVIKPTGFPLETSFYAAVRIPDGTSAWMLSSSPFSVSDTDPDQLDSLFMLGGLSVSETVLIQLAVLVYLPRDDEPATGTTEPLLRTFQSDNVYVATDITIQAERGP